MKEAKLRASFRNKISHRIAATWFSSSPIKARFIFRGILAGTMANSMKRKRIKTAINNTINHVFEAIVSEIEDEATKFKKKHWVRPFLALRKERGDFYVAVRKTDFSKLFACTQLAPLTDFFRFLIC